MKIRTKIFSTFFITGLILLIIGISALYFSFSNTLKSEINEHLITAADSRGAHIRTCFSENTRVVGLMSLGVAFSEFLEADENNPQYFQLRERARQRAENIIDTHPDEYEYINLTDKNGKVVVSTKEQNIGMDRSSEEVFLKGRENLYFRDIFVSKQDNNEPMMAISAPVKQDDELLGVVIARINTEKLYSILKEDIGLGKTGEIYLVNRDGYMISPSRFEEDVILKQKVDTVGTHDCFDVKPHPAGHIGHTAVKIFNDYRGVEVLGTHNYISETDWCLLAEIDTKESLLTVRNVLRTSIIIGIIILFLIYLAAILIGQAISKPIMRLHRGAEVIARGDLDHKVGTDVKDEIGQLSRAFDKMTAAIKKSRAEVDKKVSEQTKEIRQKNITLEDQQKAILNILEDVRLEKENTAKERDRINTILYSIGDGVFVIDKDYKIILFNQMAAKISGFLKEEAIGKRYDKILKFVYEKNNKKNDKFIIDSIKTGRIKNLSNHTVLIRKDGKRIPVADSAAPIKNKKGNIVGCVVVFHDITREREIDRAKSEFVSLASHQLRTPLTTISWFTELLLDEKIGKLNKKQKEHLQEVYRGNKRMIELVSALLNVSRIEMGTLAIEPKLISLEKIVNIVIKELSSQIKKKKMDIEKEIDKDLPDIKADPNLTKIIFQNIISNAVAYTPKKGKITIVLIKEENDILFKVKDSGYGIPKEQQSKIFTKLFRADNIIEKEPNGTGLGLYIVKAIVKQGGGKIWFESEENKGTTFYITIPLKGMKRVSGVKGLSYI